MSELFAGEELTETERVSGGGCGHRDGAVLILVAVVVGLGRRHKTYPTTEMPVAAYAKSLAIDGVQMVESTSLSGGKSTFVDGHITNNGTETVKGVTVQVLFRNDEAMPPQIVTMPLTLVRMREPYVDVEPIRAEPLKPGQGHDFRLIFEDIHSNWNGQLPEIRVVEVEP